jgi:hypothetical protein
MNAHTTIRVDETTSEASYRHAISLHCPNCTEFEMAARVDIATIRDQASAGVHRAKTDSAAAMLLVVAQDATSAVYAQRQFGDLMRLKSALTLSMMAAREMERAQRNG